MKLEDDDYCFACGKNNPYGLRLSFNYSNGKLFSEFVPSKIHQGYKDITHGGIIASILDEVMIQAAIAEGIIPVTAEINVRFKKPLMSGEEVIAEAEITKKTSRLIEARSCLIRKIDNTIIAMATAKLIPSNTKP